MMNNIRLERKTAALFVLVTFLLLSFGLMQPLLASAVEVGYRDFSYPSGTGGNSEVTGEKPESKLWWNDGSWWGSMWSTAGHAYRIHRLDLATQTWVDTGTALDDRTNSRADALWDGQRLYVVSHVFAANAGQPAPAGQRGELYRYSYDSMSKTYSLDTGFPIEVTGGKSETLVLEKDSTGTLWVTYVESQQVMVNHSLNGDDRVWGTPFAVPIVEAAGLSTDDISSIISYNQHIGVMWSNQQLKRMYFAVHPAGAADDVWPRAIAYSVSADDHINLKSLATDNAGQVFAAVKTSKSSALIVLLVCANNINRCKTDSDWKAYTVYGESTYNPTRPVLLIDTQNRNLLVFTRNVEGTQFGIYYKTASMDNIQCPAGIGVTFIKSSTDTDVNDPTSTKQNLDSTTGLVVLASDKTSKYYLHNYLDLGGVTPNPTPSPTSTSIAPPTPTNTPTPTGPITSVPIKDITFEDGSLTHPTSGADSVTGNVALNNASLVKGVYSAVVANTGSSYLQESFTAVDDVYVSWYLKVNALPTSSTRIALISNSGTTVGNIMLLTGGRLRLRNGSTTIGADSAPLTVGSIYRVGIHQKRSTGGGAILEGFLAMGDNPFGSPFASTTSGTWSTQGNRLLLGATTSASVNIVVDDIRLDSGAMPPPSGGTPSTATATPTATATATTGASPTATSTATATPTPTATGTGTSTPVNTATPTSTPTSTRTPTPTNTPTSTSTPTSTRTPTPTNTPTPTGPTTSVRIKNITFEDGSLINPTSGVDSTSGSVVLNKSSLIKGIYSAGIPGVGSAYLQEDYTAVDDVYVSWYLKVNALPSGDVRVALISNAGTTVGNLLLRTTGVLRLRNGSTTIGVDSPPLTAGVVYRLGLHQKRGSGANGMLEGYLATGDNAFGAPFASTVTGTWTTAADRFRFGATTATVLDGAFDDIRLDAASMPGLSMAPRALTGLHLPIAIMLSAPRLSQ